MAFRPGSVSKERWALNGRRLKLMATSLSLPDGVARRLGLPEPQAEARLRRTLARALYREGRLSLAEASDLAGVREDDFPDGGPDLAAGASA